MTDLRGSALPTVGVVTLSSCQGDFPRRSHHATSHRCRPVALPCRLRNTHTESGDNVTQTAAPEPVPTTPCTDPAALPGECVAEQLPGETIGRAIDPAPEQLVEQPEQQLVVEVGTPDPPPSLYLASTGVPVGPYAAFAFVVVLLGLACKRWVKP